MLTLKEIERFMDEGALTLGLTVDEQKDALFYYHNDDLFADVGIIANYLVIGAEGTSADARGFARDVVRSIRGDNYTPKIVDGRAYIEVDRYNEQRIRTLIRDIDKMFALRTRPGCTDIRALVGPPHRLGTVAAAMGVLDDPSPDERIEETLSVARSILSYMEEGEPTIVVPEGLHIALKNTDPHEATEEDTLFPFRTFMVHFEKPIGFLTDVLLGVDTPTVIFSDKQTVTDEEVSEAKLVVWNLCLYMAHVDPGRTVSNADEIRALEAQIATKKGKKRARLQNKLDRTTAYTTVCLGGQHHQNNATAPNTPSTADNDPRREHWVRGHWRNQPYGPRSNPKYRMTWIMPHVRYRESEAGKTIKTYIPKGATK
jgi:hypothetical protein